MYILLEWKSHPSKIKSDFGESGLVTIARLGHSCHLHCMVSRGTSHNAYIFVMTHLWNHLISLVLQVKPINRLWVQSPGIYTALSQGLVKGWEEEMVEWKLGFLLPSSAFLADKLLVRCRDRLIDCRATGVEILPRRKKWIFLPWGSRKILVRDFPRQSINDHRTTFEGDSH